MIKSFADAPTQDIFEGSNSRAARSLPRAIWDRARRKMDVLRYATSEKDLALVPGNRFEHLKGDRAGKCSLRINEQWRLVFRFEDGNAYEVQISDYH